MTDSEDSETFSEFENQDVTPSIPLEQTSADVLSLVHTGQTLVELVWPNSSWMFVRTFKAPFTLPEHSSQTGVTNDHSFEAEDSETFSEFENQDVTPSIPLEQTSADVLSLVHTGQTLVELVWPNSSWMFVRTFKAPFTLPEHSSQTGVTNDHSFEAQAV
ncbi:hypothetical protein J6590_103372 [Homalodisca vitripennis]|nr:hypothetical protein J6590_103372 [Homalodisca vitripennis]